MKDRIKAIMDYLSHAHLCLLPSDCTTAAETTDCHRLSLSTVFVGLNLQKLHTIHTVYILYVFILCLSFVSKCSCIIFILFYSYIKHIELFVSYYNYNYYSVPVLL